LFEIIVVFYKLVYGLVAIYLTEIVASATD